MMNDEAARFLLQQNNETIRFLIAQKITYINAMVSVCMLWWVSSVVLYGSVLAAVWSKQTELKAQPSTLNWLGFALSVLFLATAAFGVLAICYSLRIQAEIHTLATSLGGHNNFFNSELSGFRLAMAFGAGTFLLITFIWMVFWCNLQGGLKKLAKRILGGFKKLAKWVLRNKKQELLSKEANQTKG